MLSPPSCQDRHHDTLSLGVNTTIRRDASCWVWPLVGVAVRISAAHTSDVRIEVTLCSISLASPWSSGHSFHRIVVPCTRPIHFNHMELSQGRTLTHVPAQLAHGPLRPSCTALAFPPHWLRAKESKANGGLPDDLGSYPHCTARRHQGAYYTSAWMSGKCVHRSHRQATHRVDRCNIHTR